MDVSGFYRNTMFAEQELILYNERNEKRDTFPVHRIVWSMGSNYFDSLFVRWDKKEYEISYHVEETYVDAFGIVVKYFYTNDVDTTDVKMLYKVLVLSDKLGCALTDDCVRILRVLPESSIDIEDLCLFYSALLGLTGNSELMESVSSVLMSKVGDFERVLTDEHTLKEFMKLSPEALKSLLYRKDVRTDCEDTILVVTYLWVTEGKGKGLSLDVLKEIGNGISLSNLSDLFIDQLVSAFEWIDMTREQFLFFRQWKQYKNLLQLSAFTCDVIIEDTNAKDRLDWLSKERVIVQQLLKGLTIDVNMVLFIEWFRGEKMESFDVPFIFRNQCIVYDGKISVTRSTVELNFNAPRVFRTSLHMIHTYDGYVSLRVTKEGLMNISEKFYFVGICKSCMSYKCMYDMIPTSGLSVIDKMSFYLRIN